MLDLFAWDAVSGGKVPAVVEMATEQNLAVDILYAESARHSNANLLHIEGGHKRYVRLPEHCL